MPLSHRKDKTPFIQGVFAAIVFVPVLAPFAAIFGIFSASLDLSGFQTFMYSLVVLAGAAQIASLSLLEQGAPVLIAIFTGAILNLRMLMYSAALAPHFRGLSLKRRFLMAYGLVDQCFVLGQQRFENDPEESAFDKSQYYLGIALVILTLWFSASMLGYYFGGLIPEKLDISFGLPLSFIALIAPSLKSPPHIVAAAISIIGALLFNAIPYNLGLLIAGVMAIIAAAEVERRIDQRKQND